MCLKYRQWRMLNSMCVNGGRLKKFVNLLVGWKLLRNMIYAWLGGSVVWTVLRVWRQQLPSRVAGTL